jgi:hypothetical protein
MQAKDKLKKYSNARRVCARYGGISLRTVDRWVEAGVLPPPIYIQGQRYWLDEKLDAHDEARANEVAS